MNTDKMLPLEGIKVVELATVVAAPTAGRMLCAYGAEVIKVENLIGDDLRRAGEFERVVCEDYKNPIFTIQNSGKKLVALNLKSEEGKRAMLKLLEDADVFLSNVRAASLARLGLDYETLSAAYPGLIYAHFSGFGPKGPSAADPGFDSTAFWLHGRLAGAGLIPLQSDLCLWRHGDELRALFRHTHGSHGPGADGEGYACEHLALRQRHLVQLRGCRLAPAAVRRQARP